MPNTQATHSNTHVVFLLEKRLYRCTAGMITRLNSFQDSIILFFHYLLSSPTRLRMGMPFFRYHFHLNTVLQNNSYYHTCLFSTIMFPVSQSRTDSTALQAVTICSTTSDKTLITWSKVMFSDYGSWKMAGKKLPQEFPLARRSQMFEINYLRGRVLGDIISFPRTWYRLASWRSW